MSAPVAPETSALLALIVPANGAVSSDSTDALYKAVEPLHAAIEMVAARVTAVQVARRAADRTEEAAYAYVYFERIKQGYDGMLREISAAAEHLERACETAFQLDQHAIEMQTGLDTREERLAAEAKMMAERVVISKAEYDHLVARAEAGAAALSAANAAAAVPVEKP